MTDLTTQVMKALEELSIKYAKDARPKCWKRNGRRVGTDGSAKDVISQITDHKDFIRGWSKEDLLEKVLPIVSAMEQGAVVSEAVALWETFNKSKERDRFEFVIDQNNTPLILTKTGKRNGQTVEVKPHPEKLGAVRELSAALHAINPSRYDQKSAELLFEYIDKGVGFLFQRRTIHYVSEPQAEMTFTYKLIDEVIPNPDRSGLKAWNEFLDRISDPVAYAAFVWSIYEPKHRGRQILYVQGPDGEDGKTVSTKAHLFFIGMDYGAAMNPSDFSQENRFALSKAYGKRLLILPDISNENLLKYPKIKQISGRDPVAVEWKNDRQITTILDCRIIACSNFALRMENASFERSRILWLRVAPIVDKSRLDPDWEPGLTKEYPAFLAYAKDCYNKVCERHYAIKSRASETLVYSIASAAEDDLKFRLNRIFAPAENGFIERTEFSERCREVGMNNNEIASAKTLLAKWYEDFDINKHPNAHQSANDGKIYRGLKIKADFTAKSTLFPEINRTPPAGKSVECVYYTHKEDFLEGGVRLIDPPDPLSSSVLASNPPILPPQPEPSMDFCEICDNPTMDKICKACSQTIPPDEPKSQEMSQTQDKVENNTNPDPADPDEPFNYTCPCGKGTYDNYCLDKQCRHYHTPIDTPETRAQEERVRAGSIKGSPVIDHSSFGGFFADGVLVG